MSISQCDFYVCDPTKTCFKRSVDLNENATQESAWSKLKDIGNEVITEFLSLRSIDKITYLIASIGASPWRNEKTLGGEIRQGYWSKNILTHAYRFIPHKLVDFWDKYGKSNNVETVTFYIDGQKCYLECLGFIGKIETAFGGGAVFRTVNNITWRLPEVRSYYDNYYNNFLELYDLNDADSIYYLNMSNYPDSDPLKQEYDAAVQSSDWTSFQQFLDDNYEDYKNDFLSEIDVGKSITSLAGLWNVYDGNTLIPVSETQPYPFNHLYHDSIVIKDGQEYKYRETGTTYFIFENGKIKLPTKEIPVNINGTDYWASSRVKDKLDPTKVDGTYIMEIDNNTIQERTISF